MTSTSVGVDFPGSASYKVSKQDWTPEMELFWLSDIVTTSEIWIS